MQHGGSDLRERLQNEKAVVHLGVREDEFGRLEDESVILAGLVEQQVEIDGAGTLGRRVRRTDAAHGMLDGQESPEELEGA